MPLDNSVSRLRAQELAQSTRPFLARGSRMNRCNDCLLDQDWCCCNERPIPSGDIAICLIYFKGEVYKPSNTGRLVADVLADNHAFLWSRTQPDAALIQLLKNENYAPVLIFPDSYVAEERRLSSGSRLSQWQATINAEQKKPLLVVLDGTWREARKMVRADWLQQIPVLGIDPENQKTSVPGLAEPGLADNKPNSSGYDLREAFHQHQLGTAEVMVQVLEKLGDANSAEALQHWFERFQARYLDSKPFRKAGSTASPDQLSALSNS
ncbi:MAG: tRNA-uridine aminocarboxypropyltransferase [Oceanobacter sp.]